MKLNDGSIYTAWVKLNLTLNVNSQDYCYLPDKNYTQCLMPLWGNPLLLYPPAEVGGHSYNN